MPMNTSNDKKNRFKTNWFNIKLSTGVAFVLRIREKVKDVSRLSTTKIKTSLTTTLY